MQCHYATATVKSLRQGPRKSEIESSRRLIDFFGLRAFAVDFGPLRLESRNLPGVLPKSERMGDGYIMFTAEPPSTPSFAEVVMKLCGNSAFFAARR